MSTVTSQLNVLVVLKIAVKSVVSHFNTVLLRFVSDNSVQKSGFHVDFAKGLFLNIRLQLSLMCTFT